MNICESHSIYTFYYYFTVEQGDSPEDGAVMVVIDLVVGLVLLDALGEAEISDLHRRLVLHQNVARRQVPVDVVLAAQVLHPLEKQAHTQRHPPT